MMTYAEGLYRRRHKKQVESTEDYLHRVTVAYNEIYSLINKVSDSRSYIQASNEINAFSKIVGKNATDVLKLRKQLINRIKTLIEDNDTKIQDLKQEIEDIQSFDVSDTMEEATKLDRLATNRMYSFLRRMIVEERQVPYIQVGTKYIINYSLFLQRLNEKGD